jgi:hypothetical protein
MARSAGTPPATWSATTASSSSSLCCGDQRQRERGRLKRLSPQIHTLDIPVVQSVPLHPVADALGYLHQRPGQAPGLPQQCPIGMEEVGHERWSSTLPGQQQRKVGVHVRGGHRPDRRGRSLLANLAQHEPHRERPREEEDRCRDGRGTRAGGHGASIPYRPAKAGLTGQVALALPEADLSRRTRARAAPSPGAARSQWCVGFRVSWPWRFLDIPGESRAPTLILADRRC